MVFLLGLAMSLLAVPTRSYSAPPPKESAVAAQLPSSFRWSSSGQLISPGPDASHPVVSVKDPTVVQANGKWHVFMTTANTAGSWSLAYTSFTDWSGASAAPLTYLDTNPNIGTGYRAAPQVFYFAPKNLWYLVYQTGPPSYSTSTDPGNPQSWSAPRTFQNAAPSGTLDYWNICDSAMCYLFSADDNGHVYRSETTVGEFPGGFRTPDLCSRTPSSPCSRAAPSTAYRAPAPICCCGRPSAATAGGTSAPSRPRDSPVSGSRRRPPRPIRSPAPPT